jgi:dipeptidase
MEKPRPLLRAGVLAGLAMGLSSGQLPTLLPTLPVDPAQKSIAFYVGKNLTADGSVLLGGFGHEPSSHWLEITPAREFPPGTRLEVGITADARLPGERIRIPQEGRTARFITSNYSEFAGFPPPLTNGGLNQHHVAARTVWSPSRPELVAMTPNPQHGLSYSDLARAVMERATTAREAVELVGALIDSHGYATYGGNSFLFADPEEGWAMVTYAGGQGLWAAERLGPDRVRVLYPGYLGDFPVDFLEDPDFMGSANLVELAVEKGWFDPTSGPTLNPQEVYGLSFPGSPGPLVPEDEHPFRYPPEREAELRALAPVSVADMLALVRDPRWSDDRAGYGQVAHLRPGLPPELGVLWVAVAPGVSTPFVPIHIGAEDVPPEYKQHRYLTKGADATFLNPEFASLEGTRSAYRIHQRLLHHTCAHPEAFLREVTAALEEFEARQLRELPGVEEEARRLLEGAAPASGASTSGPHPEMDPARALLTREAETRLLAALELGERLVERVEAETRTRFGIEMPGRPVPEGASWRPESGPMMLPPEAVGARDRQNCHVPGLETYPRRHGSHRR